MPIFTKRHDDPVVRRNVDNLVDEVALDTLAAPFVYLGSGM